jgi:hypothetical protein
MSHYPLMQQFAALTGFDFIAFFLVGFITVWVAGYAVDAIMRDAAFGPVRNGLLVAAAAYVGLYVRIVFFYSYYQGQGEVTLAAMVVAPCIFMVFLGIIKSRVARN